MILEECKMNAIKSEGFNNVLSTIRAIKPTHEYDIVTREKIRVVSAGCAACLDISRVNGDPVLGFTADGRTIRADSLVRCIMTMRSANGEIIISSDEDTAVISDARTGALIDRLIVSTADTGDMKIADMKLSDDVGGIILKANKTDIRDFLKSLDKRVDTIEIRADTDKLYMRDYFNSEVWTPIRTSGDVMPMGGLKCSSRILVRPGILKDVLKHAVTEGFTIGVHNDRGIAYLTIGWTRHGYEFKATVCPVLTETDPDYYTTKAAAWDPIKEKA